MYHANRLSSIVSLINVAISTNSCKAVFVDKIRYLRNYHSFASVLGKMCYAINIKTIYCALCRNAVSGNEFRVAGNIFKFEIKH